MATGGTQETCDIMDCDVTEMAALGRRFEVGDLYNYRDDSVIAVPGQRLIRDRADFKLETEIVANIKVESVGHDSGSSYNRWKHVGIDEHLRGSIAAGIIKCSGCSRYLTDRYQTGQASRTLIIRLEYRKECMDLQTVNQENGASSLCRATGEKNGELSSEATHLILGVVYGTEAYCVLTQDTANGAQEAEDDLAELTAKMEIALKENRNAVAFTEQFDGRQIERLSRVKCRLYADFQTHLVRECCACDAYKHCLRLIQQTKQRHDSQATPVSAVLCPLKSISASAGGGVRVFDYRDVDPKLVLDCCRIFDSLERITAAADAADAACATARKIHGSSLRPFRQAVAAYRKVLGQSLKNEMLKARRTASGNDDDESIERIVRTAQNHPLFKPSRLQRWLRHKQSELQMADTMVNVKGITFVADRSEMERQLANTLDRNYALVLNIPRADDDTNALLAAMRRCLRQHAEPTPQCCKDDTDEEGNGGMEEDALPWHMIQHERKQVFDAIRQFANHVEKNKHVEGELHYFITFGDRGKGGCSYSVYEADHLVKTNLDALPHPPTDLRADYLTTDDATAVYDATSSALLRVLWNHRDVGYRCHFLVEFRPRGSCDKSWMQRKTTLPGDNQTIISFPKGSAMEIRVAADTCVGRSDFTCVFDSESLAAEDETSKHRVPYDTNRCAKDDAMIGEEVRLDYPPYAGLFFPIRSRLKAPPENRRIAEVMAMENSRLIEPGRPNIHLLDVRENSTDGDFRWMDVGRVSAVSRPCHHHHHHHHRHHHHRRRRDHKVIMLTGARGGGKSGLIDGMINYILGVQWHDPFRFKGVREGDCISESDRLVGTSSVTAYTIRHEEGMAIPYSITIIDTPGYVNKGGGETDRENVRKIRRFLTQKKMRIDHVHAICFVAASNDIGSMKMEAHNLDPVLSLFAKDVEDNIRLLVTSADGAHPQTEVVDTRCGVDAKSPATSAAFAHNQFDNSLLYACNEQGEGDSCFDQLLWRIGQHRYRLFFAALEKMKGRHLESTREVIHRRLLLDQSLKDIERGLEVYLVHVENILMFGRKIRQYSAKMEASQNFLLDRTEVRRLEVNCDKGWMAYNCRQCRRTCEGPMRSVSLASIRRIKRQCCHLFCPCPASQHDYQRFQWRHVSHKVTTTLWQMKAEYESNFSDKLTTERLLMDCQHELKVTKAKLFCLLARVGSSCLVLEATALRPHTLSLADYLSLMRGRVAEESAPGYLTRLEILNELQQSLSRRAPENKAVQPDCDDDSKGIGYRPYQPLQLIGTDANSLGIGDCWT